VKGIRTKTKEVIKQQRLTRELKALGIETETVRPSNQTDDKPNEDEEKWR
jgi:hypothetical protein